MANDDRGPGPATIERVIAAWQRAREGLAADEMLASDEATVNVALPTEDQTARDVDAILKRITSAMLFASLRETEADELSKAMAARKARYKQRGEMLRRELLDILLLLGRPRFVATEGTVSVRTIPGSLVITDEELIPDAYMIEKVVRTPDKRALEADLAQGVVIDGATLSNGGYGLSFRRQRGAGEAVRVED